MICYKDKTYCSSEQHLEACQRQITEEEKEHAAELGLGIAYADFCGSVDRIGERYGDIVKELSKE